MIMGLNQSLMSDANIAPPLLSGALFGTRFIQPMGSCQGGHRCLPRASTSITDSTGRQETVTNPLRAITTTDTYAI
jgi:hypothetical protein